MPSYFMLIDWEILESMNFDFKFQVFPSHQDRKKNRLVCFLGEVMAQQFYFDICWPLPKPKTVQSAKK